MRDAGDDHVLVAQRVAVEEPAPVAAGVLGGQVLEHGDHAALGAVGARDLDGVRGVRDEAPSACRARRSFWPSQAVRRQRCCSAADVIANASSMRVVQSPGTWWRRSGRRRACRWAWCAVSRYGGANRRRGVELLRVEVEVVERGSLTSRWVRRAAAAARPRPRCRAPPLPCTEPRHGAVDTEPRHPSRCAGAGRGRARAIVARRALRVGATGDEDQERQGHEQSRADHGRDRIPTACGRGRRAGRWRMILRDGIRSRSAHEGTEMVR